MLTSRRIVLQALFFCTAITSPWCPHAYAQVILIPVGGGGGGPFPTDLDPFGFEIDIGFGLSRDITGSPYFGHNEEVCSHDCSGEDHSFRLHYLNVSGGLLFNLDKWVFNHKSALGAGRWPDHAHPTDYIGWLTIKGGINMPTWYIALGNERSLFYLAPMNISAGVDFPLGEHLPRTPSEGDRYFAWGVRGWARLSLSTEENISGAITGRGGYMSDSGPYVFGELSLRLNHFRLYGGYGLMFNSGTIVFGLKLDQQR